jgi:glycosyltransferase involved in cell wall biosynthesis
MRTMRVGINCEIAPGHQPGGTQSVTAGLVAALGRLDGPEKYVLVAHPENGEWLKPLAAENTEIVFRPQRREGLPAKRARAFFRAVFQKLTGERNRVWREVERSDGFYESLNLEVFHWPSQTFRVTALPSIYNPHDLQHLHLPQFFPPQQITERESIYPVACRIAHTVVAASSWIKMDLMRWYGIHEDRIQVIPWAPPIMTAEAPEQNEVERIRAKYQLPRTFAFYPAVTWPHKNHIRLLQAIARVRDQQNLSVSLVCTGHLVDHHWPKVEAERKRLHLESLVHFLGHISVAELRAVYRAAQFVIIPTLFEAASGPVLEAWQEGVPVACSSVTSLPEQAGDAAMLFDPLDTNAISDALARMSTDETLRDTLRQKGSRRVADFSWERTAKAYRAAYRRAAGRLLSSEEKELLAWDWMRDPRRDITL